MMPSMGSIRLDSAFATIDELLGRVVAAWDPEQIWLFGSRARGSANAASDWDLLVVVPDSMDESALDPVAAWQLRKDARVRADIVPCRASDFREDRATPNTLAFEAATRGQLLYER
jgi:predicted nucleotidyltransferase